MKLSALSRIIRKCLVKNREARFKRLNRDGLRPVSIISNNCLGGMFYHDLNFQFKSPTINLFFANNSYRFRSPFKGILHER